MWTQAPTRRINSHVTIFFCRHVLLDLDILALRRILPGLVGPAIRGCSRPSGRPKLTLWLWAPLLVPRNRLILKRDQLRSSERLPSLFTKLHSTCIVQNRLTEPSQSASMHRGQTEDRIAHIPCAFPASEQPSASRRLPTSQMFNSKCTT